MREYFVLTLVLLGAPLADAQTVPPNWQIIKDSKGACQIAVPPDWASWGDNAGAAVFQDVSTAIAVVTSQPGQAFKPLTEAMMRMLDLRKEKIFENSSKRIFYQERTSTGPQVPNAYSVSVPGKDGTCSGRVNFLPSVSTDTVKKIVLSLGPVPAEPDGGS